MGVGYNFLCTDCKEYARIGYGSYGTWLWANTIEAYEKLPSMNKELHKNQNLEFLLRKHDKHTLFVLNMDMTYERDNKIYVESGSHYNPQPDELIADISDYKRLEPNDVQESTKHGASRDTQSS